MALEWVITVPSGSLSAGSFVDPVASRSSSREPFRSHLHPRLVNSGGSLAAQCHRCHELGRFPLGLALPPLTLGISRR
jgi:hypothetical protein